MEATRRKLGDDLDKILAILGSISAIVLILYLSFAVGRLIYVIVGVLVFLACLTWLGMRKRSSAVLASLSTLHTRKSAYLMLGILFSLFFALSVISLYLRPEPYTRPVSYFLFTAFMVGIVALEILFAPSKKYEYVILMQVVITGISLAWSELSIFPNVVGVDSWWHQAFTLKILQNGSIPEGYAYSKLPMFHLLAGSTSLITSSSYKIATMLSISIIQVVCNVTFIFLLGRFILNSKIGLLASLLLIVSNYHIFMSHWTIPNSLAATFIPIILYLLFKTKKKEPKPAIALALFFMVMLVLTHTVTAMAMAIILFTLWAGSNIYGRLYGRKSTTTVTLVISIFFVSAMFSWWTYASGHIRTFGELIKWGFSVDYFHRSMVEEVIGYMDLVPFSEQLFKSLGMFLFFALSFVGCFHMISKKYGNQHSFALASAGAAVLAIGFFSLITAHSVLENRWWYFSQIMLAIPLALAFFLLIGAMRNGLRKALLAFALAAFLSFLMIMSPTANIDNPMLSPNTGIRYAFTESEIQATAFFVENSEGTISSDFDYFTNPSSSIPYNYHNVSYGRIESLDSFLYDGRFERDGRIIVIREEIIDRPFRLSGGIWRLDYNLKEVLEDEGFSKIYDCGSVSGYY